MPYINRSMSEGAKAARDMGKLPLTSISSGLLKSKGFLYPRSFYVYLCKKQYILPERHHASAAKRLYKYYDLNAVPFIVKSYNLDNLYLLYRNRKTKDEILRERGAEYVKVAINGKRFATQRIVILDGILLDGQIFWKQGVAIDMRDAQVIQNYGFDKPIDWANPNTKKILHKALIYKKVKANRYI